MTALVLSLPATFRLLAVFAAAVGLLRLKVPLGAALAAGSLLAVALEPAAWGAPAATLVRAFFTQDTLSLLLAVLATLLLAALMREGGCLDLAVSAFRARVRSRRAALVFFPAVVGLIPMPGGAVFSCAMVERAAEGIYGPARQAAVNYWFRHVWEFAWPLYPAVILVASQMAGRGVSQAAYLAAQAPFSLVALAAGALFMLRSAPPRAALGPDEAGEAAAGGTAAGEAATGGLLEGISPILVVVAFAALLALGDAHPATRPLVEAIPPKLRLLPACLAAIAWTILCRGLGRERVRAALAYAQLPAMSATILGIALFSGTVKESGLAAEVGAEFAASGVPLPLALAALPFLAGLVTGVTIAMIGASFPILYALSEAAAGGAVPLPHVLLAYAAGFVGIMVSPMHLCLALTAGHFKVGVRAVLAECAGPAAATLAAGFLAYALFT